MKLAREKTRWPKKRERREGEGGGRGRGNRRRGKSRGGEAFSFDNQRQVSRAWNRTRVSRAS